MRRFFHIVAFADIIALLAIACSRWECDRSINCLEFGSANGHYWRITGDPDGLNIFSIRGWVSNEPLKLSLNPAARSSPRSTAASDLIFTSSDGDVSYWHHCGLWGEQGSVRAAINADGTAQRTAETLPPDETTDPYVEGWFHHFRWSTKLRYWKVENVPWGAVTLPLAITLFIIIGLSFVDRIGRMRRLQQGRCVRCGYDLRIKGHAVLSVVQPARL